jgi:hypothetical protein
MTEARLRNIEAIDEDSGYYSNGRRYLLVVADMAAALSLNKVLELGAHLHPLIEGSDIARKPGVNEDACAVSQALCMYSRQLPGSPQGHFNELVIDASVTKSALWDSIDDDTFDLFISTQTFEHIRHYQREGIPSAVPELWKHIRRVSKAAIISIPYMWTWKEDSHHMIGDDELEKWFGGYQGLVETITVLVGDNHTQDVRIFRFDFSQPGGPPVSRDIRSSDIYSLRHEPDEFKGFTTLCRSGSVGCQPTFTRYT